MNSVRLKNLAYFCELMFIPRWHLLFVSMMILAGIVHDCRGSEKEVTTEYIRIEEICFTGNKVTREQIIYREMTIKPGMQIALNTLDEVLQTNKTRILNLQLFSRVHYEVRMLSDTSVGIDFELNEIVYWIPQPIFTLADRNFNVWWKEMGHALSRTNIGLQLTRLNFRGRSERLGGTVQLGYNKYFDLYYKIPFIDRKLKQGLGWSITYATGREMNFRTRLNKLDFYRDNIYPYRYVQTELSYTYRPAYFLLYELNLGYTNYGITQPFFERNPDFLGGRRNLKYLELRLNVAYNNTDVRVYPLKGIDAKTILMKRGLGIDQQVNQMSVRTEFSVYQPINRFLFASFVFRGRLSFPQEQPYLFERALGFRNEYVRGYEYYVVDGSHYGVFRINLRQRLLDRIVHQSFTPVFNYVPIRIYAKLFNDWGYTYHAQPETSFLNNRFLHGYGFGIDIVLSYYAKFRFEYSFNHLGQNGLFLHGNKE